MAHLLKSIIEGLKIASVKTASDYDVATLLAADPESPDGRSQFFWFKTTDGSIGLIVFPHGDTFATMHEKGIFP